MTKPYISIIVTTRNDNYGENMQRRLDMFIKGLDFYQKQYPGLFELVIVEWNPPADRGPLNEVLIDCENLPIRVVTVPKIYHDLTGLKRPLAEWPAKNVGLVRAQGDFVLIANPDILLSPDLVSFFSKKDLDIDAVYRCDRYDFNGDGIENVLPESYIDFAFPKIFRLHGMQGHLSLTLDIDMSKDTGTIPTSTYNEYTVHTNASGDFMLISKNLAEKLGGLYEGFELGGHHGDSVSLYRFIYRGAKLKLFDFPKFILHQDHDRTILPIPYDPGAVHRVARKDESANWGIQNIELPIWSNGVGDR